MKLAKEIFIMVLLLAIVVFMVGLIFYEYMPNNKTVPEPITYSTESSTTAVIQEITATSATGEEDNEAGALNDSPLLASFSVGAKDLVTAAEKNSYRSGKTDPFADYNEVDESNTVKDGNTTTSTNTTKGSTSTSSGTFFEKPNSK